MGYMVVQGLEEDEALQLVTVVFQEQEDGTYKGIYIENNGINNDWLQTVLVENYQDRKKIKSLIDRKCILTSLGNTNQIITGEEAENMNPQSLQAYSILANNYIDSNGQYYKADKIDQLRAEKYIILDGHNEVCGETITKADGNTRVIPFTGQEDCTTLFLQDLKGRWLVSYLIDETYQEDEIFRTWSEWEYLK
ncbi:hypothetical protein [Mammaliicoccus sciuri]|uniref:hypothetical protein n=1 Tax=Mammaliicoccus sciuri TaxID=1296 RepID=UPI003F54895D